MTRLKNQRIFSSETWESNGNLCHIVPRSNTTTARRPGEGKGSPVNFFQSTMPRSLSDFCRVSLKRFYWMKNATQSLACRYMKYRVSQLGYWICYACNWGMMCQKQGSRAGTSNYILQYLWDVITCPCPWYLLLTTLQNSVACSCVLSLVYVKYFTNTLLMPWSTNILSDADLAPCYPCGQSDVFYTNRTNV